MGAKAERKYYMWAAILTVFSAVLFRQALIGSVLYGLAGLLVSLVAYVSWDIANRKPADSLDFRSLCLLYFFFGIGIRYGKYRYKRFIRDLKHKSTEIQHNVLLKIMKLQQNTTYGKEFNFHNVSTREDLKKIVPLADYSHFAPYTQRIADGESNVLTTQPVLGLSTSSGTTGKSKLIPFVKFDSGLFTILLTMYHVVFVKLNKLTSGQITRPSLGKTVTLSYKPKVRYSEKGGLPIAPMSYHYLKTAPHIAETTPREIREVGNEEAALYIIAVFSLKEREVGMFNASFSTVAYSFWKLVMAEWRHICDDIARGQLRESPDVEPSLMESFNKKLEADPCRAETLRKEFIKGVEGIMQRVWPGCVHALVVTTGGFAQHAKWLEENAHKGIHHFSSSYGASEANPMGMNLSEDPSDLTYTLLVNIIFFEFIPEDQCDLDNPTTLCIDQVEVGKNYEVVVTTKVGMYRYRMGDIVKVVSKIGDCPQCQFQHRLGQMLNLVWEKTPESVFYFALTKTLDELDMTMNDYTACEDIHVTPFISHHDESKHYVLFIEFSDDRNLSSDQITRFDDNLRQYFEIYDDLREKGSISRMQVVTVRTGTFLDVKRVLIQDTQNIQFKFPRVLRKPEGLEVLAKNVISNKDI